jgi:NhaA family Na+:H+ antiporter
MMWEEPYSHYRIFYSNDIQWVYLQAAAGFFVLLLVFNYFDLRMVALYLFIGFFAWFCFLKSGVHPTVAGVLIALTIPARRKKKLKILLRKLKLTTKFENINGRADSQDLCWAKKNRFRQLTTSQRVSKGYNRLSKYRNSLSDFTANLVMPIFALANAST